MTPDSELYVMVGEIRADVKTLVAREHANSKKIGTLEKRTLIGGTLVAAILALKDPSTWYQWIMIAKGLVG